MIIYRVKVTTIEEVFITDCEDLNDALDIAIKAKSLGYGAEINKVKTND